VVSTDAFKLNLRRYTKVVVFPKGVQTGQIVYVPNEAGQISGFRVWSSGFRV
jgi:hypothetical protein